MRLINFSIDVTKINKDRLYKGKNGTYLNLTVEVKDEPDQYGNDASAWESQTKEEREAKEKRNFLGNGKTVYTTEMIPAKNDDGMPF